MLHETATKIEFIDLQAQRRALGENLNIAIANVLEHGNYILGPEVQQLEEQLSKYTGCADAITCSNGTDALKLLLMAYNVGPGDAVFVPTFTFASTAEVIAQSNATPVFVDICPHTFNMDINSLQQAIASIKGSNLTPKGIIAVDLFGLPADYPAIEEIAKQHQLWVIADAAQSFGGAIKDKKVGSLATTTAASFFPSKPLACYGDGGAIFTMDKEMGVLLRSLRNHGCGKHRYDHIHIGMNSRLDTIQAAILIEKLRIFPGELSRRNEIAIHYGNALKDHVEIPVPPKAHSSAWGLYTIKCKEDQRETMITHLQEKNIPCNVYYRKPLHLQPAYSHYPRALPQLHHAEKACQQVLSLPMHPYLTDGQVEYIAEGVKEGL